MSIMGRLRASATTEEILIAQAKKNNSIIFGGRAIKKHIGFFARPTRDFDVLSTSPKRSARQLERKLDTVAQEDIYFTQPALHPGTTKVMNKGRDMRKGTKDDFGIADYSKPRRGIKSKRINGVRYVLLSETIKDKRKAIADKQFAFRKEKDLEDIRRIKRFRRFNR